MVVAPGMCAMWHRDPRPMLQSVTLDEGGPQQFRKRMVEVLCDDGEWHVGRLEAWHFGPAGTDCLISWRGDPVREYTGWYRFRKGSVRRLSDELPDET